MSQFTPHRRRFQIRHITWKVDTAGDTHRWRGYFAKMPLIQPSLYCEAAPASTNHPQNAFDRAFREFLKASPEYESTGRLDKLVRPWFAGGTITITIASVQAEKHFLAEGEQVFEEGTLNYLNIPAVEIGLKHLSDIEIDAIHDRVSTLTSCCAATPTGVAAQQRDAAGARLWANHYGSPRRHPDNQFL